MSRQASAMVSTAVIAAPSYRVRGTIGYLRDEQKLPTLGMGLVARFGGHSAAVCLALHKKADCSIAASSKSACDMSFRANGQKLLAGVTPYRDKRASSDGGTSARLACQLYDCSGQFWGTTSTGSQLDLMV